MKELNDVDLKCNWGVLFREEREDNVEFINENNVEFIPVNRNVNITKKKKLRRIRKHRRQHVFR